MMDTGERFQIQKKIKYALKVIARILTVLFILLISLFLFLRSPWGQSIIVNKVTNYVSSKTGSTVAIDRLFFTFSGNLYLEGLYLEDQKQDTLLYSQKIETGIRPIPLLRGEGIQVSQFIWKGLVANISRDQKTGKFNFDFIPEAFAKQEPSDANTQPTSSTPEKTASLPISLEPIHLENFNLTYRDEVTGVDASVNLGTFDVDIQKLDLDKSEFHIRQLEFQKSNLSYHQFKPSLPADEVTSEASLAPIFIFDDVAFREIKAEYRNNPDKIRTAIDIGEFKMQDQKADLSNQIIAIDSISLNKTFVLFHNYADESSTSDLALESTPSSFSWPDWNIEIGQVALDHNRLEYKTKNEPPIRGYFNPDVIVLHQLNLLAGNIFLKNQQAGLTLQQFGFVDAGGFQLKDLRFGLTASETKIQIEKLGILTNRSELNLDLTARYPSLQELMQTPEIATLDISVKNLLADIQDAYYFDPALAKEEMTQKLASSPFNLSLLAKGSLNQLDFDFLNMSWGKETKFHATGSLGHLTAMDNLTFDFPTIALRTNKKTLSLFVDDQSLGIRIPENIDLSGTAKGKLDDLAASLMFNSELGQFAFSGEFEEKDQMSFNADLAVQNLLLGQLLDDPQLDTLTFHLKASGSGKGIQDLNANLSTSFQKLKAYNYDYSGLSLEGQMDDGSGAFKLWLEDKFLDFDLITKFDLDSVNSQADLALNVKGADFHQLGLTSQDLRTKFLFNTQFAGNLSNFEVKTSIRDAFILLDEQTSTLGGLDIAALVRDDTMSLDLTSLMANGYIRSNASPQKVAEALQIQLNHYLKEGDTVAREVEGVEMSLDFTFNEAPVLKEIFLPGLEKLDSVHLVADFKAKEHLLSAALDLPYLKYGDGEIDSLAIRTHAAKERLDVSFEFQNLKSDPLSMDETYLVGELKDSQIILDFNSYAGDKKIVHLASHIGLWGDTFSVHIIPDEIILNREVWQMPDNNQVLIAEGYLHFQDFILSRNLQELIIREDLQDPEHLALILKEFKLENITSLLNPDDPLARGILNGELTAAYPFGETGFLANFEINALQAMDIRLGNLSLEAKSQQAGNYKYDLVLKDEDIDLDLRGDFIVTEEGGLFDLNLDLNKIEMTLLSDLSGDELQEGSGYLSGNIQASGTTAEPRYQGYFRFNDLSFVLAQLNSRFLLSSETIRLDNNGIYLDQFTFQDDQHHQFSIDGNILTESYTNPSFDLNINAEDFIAINSTMEDNEMFFGKGIIDAQVSVKGDLEVPVIDANLKVKKGTDLTFIVPESELELIEREGVVVFVNRADTNVNLTGIQQETYANFTGYDIKAIVVIDADAEFNVIVDERSGDNLLVAGEANLSMEIDPTGRMTLSGNYELRKGHYEMSLYNIVSRRFEIAEGSRISWNGEPMDAALNISAIYSLKTASTDLMTTQLSATDEASRTQYLQELPFLVFLNVDGELLRPQISFRLDMPEDQRGAFGGNVYARVMQINEQEDELNNQVFSLLVLNKFFPTTGNDGSTGGTSAIAKRSVSQALSGQLNAFSSRLLGESGLELDFDFDSYTDYQSGSAQDRTQMTVSARKRFLDDRLIIQVGSQVDIEGRPQNSDQAGSLLGNISVEYYLTEDGMYRLRGFRRNQFESIIDGQLVITGVGIIFNREFNRFLELWQRSDTNELKTDPNPDMEHKKSKRENKERPKSSSEL